MRVGEIWTNISDEGMLTKEDIGKNVLITYIEEWENNPGMEKVIHINLLWRNEYPTQGERFIEDFVNNYKKDYGEIDD